MRLSCLFFPLFCFRWRFFFWTTWRRFSRWNCIPTPGSGCGTGSDKSCYSTSVFPFPPVRISSLARYASASSRQLPHISGSGEKETQSAGRSGLPNRRQRNSASRFTQGIPAGFPSGIPGIGEEIDGATQHAPQPGRQTEVFSFIRIMNFSSAFEVGTAWHPQRDSNPCYQDENLVS